MYNKNVFEKAIIKNECDLNFNDDTVVVNDDWLNIGFHIKKELIEAKLGNTTEVLENIVGKEEFISVIGKDVYDIIADDDYIPELFEYSENKTLDVFYVSTLKFSKTTVGSIKTLIDAFVELCKRVKEIDETAEVYIEHCQGTMYQNGVSNILWYTSDEEYSICFTVSENGVESITCREENDIVII